MHMMWGDFQKHKKFKYNAIMHSSKLKEDMLYMWIWKYIPIIWLWLTDSIMATKNWVNMDLGNGLLPDGT